MANEYILALRNGVQKTLPSGLEVWLRPIDTGMLLSLKLPQPMMDIIEESLTGIRAGKSLDEQVDEQVDAAMNDFRMGLRYFEIGRVYGGVIAKHCFVKPKVVESDPQSEDEITIAEIATEDLMALAQIVNVPLQELASFRFGQNSNVEPVPGGEGDVPVTQPGTEPVGVGGEPDRDDAERVVDDVSTRLGSH